MSAVDQMQTMGERIAELEAQVGRVRELLNGWEPRAHIGLGVCQLRPASELATAIRAALGGEPADE